MVHPLTSYTEMTYVSPSLLFLLCVVGRTLPALSWERTKAPRLDNLTETEVKYANIYWDYSPAERVIKSDRRTGRTGPQPRLGYRFVVPLPERMAGITYVGHAARLRVVLERARNGEALVIGALGGSITFGQAVGGWQGSYVRTFADWLTAALPPRGRPADDTRKGAPLGGGERGGENGEAADVTAATGGAAGGDGGGGGGSSTTELSGQARRLGAWGNAAVAATAAEALLPEGLRGGTRKANQQGADATGSGEALQQLTPVDGVTAGMGTRADGSGQGGTGDRSRTGVSSGGDLDSRDDDGAAGIKDAPWVWRRVAMEDASGNQSAPRVAAGGSEAAPGPAGPAAAAAAVDYRAGRAGSGRPGKHDFFNGAVPGTQSSYMSSCMHHHLPPGVDLVLVEYAVNDPVHPKGMFGDPTRRAFERLIRKLLRLPSRPAVVLVNMFATGIAHGKYIFSAERDFMEFATYYSLPAVSLKAAVMPSAAVGGAEQVSYGAIFNGGHNHPGRGGHVVIVEVLITLFTDLLRSNANTRRCDPWVASIDDDDDDGDEEDGSDSGEGGSSQEPPLVAKMRAVAARPLPPPLADGNYESEDSTCYIEQALRGLAVRPIDGWHWTDEGRNKWGYVATDVGKTLKLQVSTRLVGDRPPDQTKAPIILQIAYLSSYEGMGTAEVTCVQGCQCTPVTIDGYDRRPVSVTSMKDIQVSQHPECVVALTTRGPSKAATEELADSLNGTYGGIGNGSSTSAAQWNKFKLLGVVVGEEPGAEEGAVTWVRNESHEMSHVMRDMGKGQ